MFEKLEERLASRHTFIFGACLFWLAVLALALTHIFAARDAAIFGSFWESGRAASSGENPYLLYPHVWIPDEIKPPIPEVNLNPPSILPLFQLFALFDPMQGRLAWLAISAAVYFLSIWAIYSIKAPDRFQIFWLFVWPMAFTNLFLGQIYAVLLALGVAIWQCIRADRTVLASILMGVVVAIKPNFAIWGLLIFASRHYREAVIAGAVALVLSILPAIFYGPDIFGQWLTAAAIDRHNLFPHDVSLHGLFYRLGYPNAAYLPVFLLFLASIYWACRVRPSLYDATPVAIIVGMLCSPIAWVDYTMVIAPFIVDRKWGPSMAIAALLMIAESQWPAFVHSERLVLIPVSILATAPVLIMLGVFLKRAASQASIPDSESPSAALTA